MYPQNLNMYPRPGERLQYTEEETKFDFFIKEMTWVVNNTFDKYPPRITVTYIVEDYTE